MDITEIGASLQNQNLLSIKSHMPRGEVNAIAVCESCVMRRDSNKAPFVRYVFRDTEGRRVTGRQFDIKDMSDITKLMVKLQNSVVLVHGHLSYFQGVYIQVTSCELCSQEVSEKIKSKFFISNIPHYNTELKIFDEFLTAVASKEVLSVMALTDAKNYLLNAYNLNINEGLRGSSIMLINTFNNSLAQVTGRQGSPLMLANIFIEYLMAKGDKDPAKVLEELSSLQSIFAQSITVELRNLFALIKGAIYLHYDFQLDLYSSDAFIINTVRKFCYDVTVQKETFSNSDGVFVYEGYTVSKGDVG